MDEHPGPASKCLNAYIQVVLDGDDRQKHSYSDLSCTGCTYIDSAPFGVEINHFILSKCCFTWFGKMYFLWQSHARPSLLVCALDPAAFVSHIGVTSLETEAQQRARKAIAQELTESEYIAKP